MTEGVNGGDGGIGVRNKGETGMALKKPETSLSFLTKKLKKYKLNIFYMFKDQCKGSYVALPKAWKLKRFLSCRLRVRKGVESPLTKSFVRDATCVSRFARSN